MNSKKNKWKIGFWIYFAISLVAIFYLFGRSNFFEVDLAFTKMEKRLLEKDLKTLANIVNSKNFNATNLASERVKDTTDKDQMSKINTIELEKVILVFKDEKLFKIELEKGIQ